MPGLTRIDSLVLKLACENAIGKRQTYLPIGTIMPQVEQLNIPRDEFFEALEILSGGGYFEAKRVYAGSERLIDIVSIYLLWV